MIPCATCGATPIGTFSDGSPRYDARTCLHSPIMPGDPVDPRHDSAMETWKPLTIRLIPKDEEDARKVAAKVAKRYAEQRVAKTRYRAPRGDAAILDGFGAELAVARWMGAKWNRGNARKTDVEPDVEVRSIRRDDGFLSLYDFDHPKRRYVLTIGRFPSYRLVGWIWGREGMVEEFFTPKGSVVMGFALDYSRFLIPQDRLRPMGSLEATKEEHDAPGNVQAEEVDARRASRHGRGSQDVRVRA